MKRKSPIRHKVRSYLREGTRVDKYMRGEGKAPPKPRRIIGTPEPNYSAVVDGRMYRVEAGDVLQALDRGISRHGGEATRVTVNAI